MVAEAKQTMRRVSVIGVEISATTYDDVVSAVKLWLTPGMARGNRCARYVCVTSVHGIITARQDAELRTILNTADIATPDGMPVVWALRSFGVKGQGRVYGPTLMLRLCEALASAGHGVFLYGGKSQVLPILCERLQTRIPALQILGAYSPPFRPLTAEEDRYVIDMIRGSNAAVVFVGIGTPKQEKWMAQHRRQFPGKVMVGVGAAFDFHAGCVCQAPEWMQKAGFEWLFRLLMEPGRLWKRYLLVTPRFLPLWGLQKVQSLLHPKKAV
jgi:N-acetylglucosaminyldiphosphoundecaprenol N-acetyl-beta-D-mannosaminyltransferase